MTKQEAVNILGLYLEGHSSRGLPGRHVNGEYWNFTETEVAALKAELEDLLLGEWVITMEKTHQTSTDGKSWVIYEHMQPEEANSCIRERTYYTQAPECLRAGIFCVRDLVRR